MGIWRVPKAANAFGHLESPGLSSVDRPGITSTTHCAVVELCEQRNHLGVTLPIRQRSGTASARSHPAAVIDRAARARGNTRMAAKQSVAVSGRDRRIDCPVAVRAAVADARNNAFGTSTAKGRTRTARHGAPNAKATSAKTVATQRRGGRCRSTRGGVLRSSSTPIR